VNELDRRIEALTADDIKDTREDDGGRNKIPNESREEEFEKLSQDRLNLKGELADFEARGEELFKQFTQHNPMYLPVLNGHLLIEDLVNQLLKESLNHPECLRENLNFADKLNILQATSPLPPSLGGS
jgi:hypothetical protein